MKRILSTLLTLMLFAYPVTLCAQEEADVPVPVAMTYPLDSLLNEWNAKTYLTPSADCDPNAGNPSYPDSVYIDRLARIPSVMELAYNDVVRKFIDAYTGKLRGQVSFMLSACNFYMPIFEEALDAYNLPLELKYLPIIESALNPSAVSRAGASGLWQFMLRTGKLYGLEVNSLVDERRDPLKSSWAAARYLRDLYTIYGDWNLVIAAYNCGPGNVNKAIRYADGSTDYWKMYNHLPRETRGYVPAFIAANYIMTYYCKHNICPMETGIPVATDTVHVRKNLHFRQISELCGISMEELKSLNPQYKREIIPGETSEQTLRLPTVAMSAFIDRRDTIYDYHRDELFRNRRVVAVPEARSTRARRSTVGSGALSYHKIRNGETLGSIARNYGVTVRQLQDWNGMSNTRITAGKRLKIYR